MSVLAIDRSYPAADACIGVALLWRTFPIIPLPSICFLLEILLLMLEV